MAQVINLRCLKRTPWNFVARSQHLIDQKQVTLFKIRKSEGTACLRNWWIDCCNTNYRQEYDVRHSDQTLLLAKTEKPPKLKRQTSCNFTFSRQIYSFPLADYRKPPQLVGSCEKNSPQFSRRLKPMPKTNNLCQKLSAFILG